MSKSAGYLVRATRHFYAGTFHSGKVLYFGKHLVEFGMDSTAPVIPFADQVAAKAAIAKIEAETYYLGNGEHSRPTLRVVPVSGAPEHVRNRVVEG